MENCPNCGNKLSNIDVLCPRCGALVEVIKVNTNIPVTSSSTKMDSDKEPSNMLQPPKKDYYQNLTVYSDELPPEGMLDEPEPNEPDTTAPISKAETKPVESQGDALQVNESDKTPVETQQTNPQVSQYDHSFEPIVPIPDPVPEPEDDGFESIGVKYIHTVGESIPRESDVAPVAGMAENANVSVESDAFKDASPAKDTVSFDESAYSPDYLDAIRSIDEPESDDLSDFDPEAFMAEYRRSREQEAAAKAARTAADVEASTQTAAVLEYESPAAAEQPLSASQTFGQPVHSTEKAYLEIEEVDDSSSSAMIYEVFGDEIMQESKQDTEAEKTEAAVETQSRRAVQRHLIETNDEYDDTPNQKKRRMPVLLAILIWIVVAAAIFAGFYFLDGYITSNYGSYNEMFKDITDGKIDLDAASSPRVSVTSQPTTTADGKSAQLFGVSALSGSNIRVMPLGQTFSLQDGMANILISDYTLAKSLGVSPSASPFIADGIAFEITDGDKTYTQTTGGLSLYLDAAEYVLRQPEAPQFTTSESFFILDVSVVPGASVHINNKDFTDKINISGRLNLTIALDKYGEMPFDVVITEPGRTSVLLALTVQHEQPDATLIPDQSYSRVYDNTFVCTGMVDADAAVTAVVDVQPAVTGHADAEGRYALTCSVENYGLYEISLTASLDDHKDASETIFVELLPEVNAFSTQAQSMTVDEILTAKQDLLDTAVCVKGTVKNITATETSQLFTLLTDGGELSCYYHGLTELADDRAYTIYGIYDTEQDKFYAMYVS